VIVTMPDIPMFVIRLGLILAGRDNGRAALRRVLGGSGNRQEADNPGSDTPET
jgi:hypothetical protein